MIRKDDAHGLRRLLSRAVSDLAADDPTEQDERREGQESAEDDDRTGDHRESDADGRPDAASDDSAAQDRLARQLGPSAFLEDGGVDRRVIDLVLVTLDLRFYGFDLVPRLVEAVPRFQYF